MAIEKRNWALVKHIVLPVTELEVEVTDFLEKLAASILYKNLEYLGSVILDKSIIVGDKGELRNRVEFLKWLQNTSAIRRLEYLDVIFKFENDSFGSVFFTRHVMFQNFKQIYNNRCFELAKTDDKKWKIIKARPNISYRVQYVKPVQTKNEIDISTFLEKLVEATAHKNLEYLDSVILDEAVYFSDRGLRSKAFFIKFIKESYYLNVLEYLDVILEVTSDSTASVFFTSHALYPNLKETFDSRCYELMKVDNTWKIERAMPV